MKEIKKRIIVTDPIQMLWIFCVILTILVIGAILLINPQLFYPAA